jgi:hypothetical protein
VNATGLAFPVLALKHGYAFTFTTPEHLLTGYLGHVESGYYRDLLLVDRDGRSYKVVSALAPPASLWKLWLAAFIDYQVTVSLDITPTIPQLTLEDIKGYLPKHIGSDGKWHFGGRNAELLEEVEEASALHYIMGMYDA